MQPYYPDKLVAVKCRSFHFTWEFSVVAVKAVYIPSDANANVTLSYVLTALCEQQNKHPEGVFTMAGDFNHANLKTVLVKFVQHVKCATKGRNTLDCRVSPQPYLGQFDNLNCS